MPFSVLLVSFYDQRFGVFPKLEQPDEFFDSCRCKIQIAGGVEGVAISNVDLPEAIHQNLAPLLILMLAI